MQVCKYAIMQVCKYASMQVYKYASMHICKYTSMQVCKYASMQVCKYVSMQVCKYGSMEVHICVELPRTGIYPISRLKTRDTQQLLEKNLDNESSCFFLFFSCWWVLNGQTSVQLDSNYICGLCAGILPFCHCINIGNLDTNPKNEKMAISQPRDHKSKK